MVTPTRLRAPTDIQAVFAARRSRAGRMLVAHGLTREDEGPVRIAVVASRRVGGAVKRNRAKRLLREAARTLPWAPGQDVVLIARARCADARLDEVVDDLRQSAAHLGLIEESACR